MSPDKIPKYQSRSNRTSFKALTSGRRYSPRGRGGKGGEVEAGEEGGADRRTDRKRGGTRGKRGRERKREREKRGSEMIPLSATKGIYNFRTRRCRPPATYRPIALVSRSYRRKDRKRPGDFTSGRIIRESRRLTRPRSLSGTNDFPSNRPGRFTCRRLTFTVRSRAEAGYHSPQ